MRLVVAHQCAQFVDAEIGFLVQMNQKPRRHIDLSSPILHSMVEARPSDLQLPVILDTEEALQRIEQVARHVVGLLPLAELSIALPPYAR